MKETIVIVFRLIITLVISLMLWNLIIGGNAEEGDPVGGISPFKVTLFDNARKAYISQYMNYSDNNGVGYTKRTDTMWYSNCASLEEEHRVVTYNEHNKVEDPTEIKLSYFDDFHKE